MRGHTCHVSGKLCLKMLPWNVFALDILGQIIGSAEVICHVGTASQCCQVYYVLLVWSTHVECVGKEPAVQGSICIVLIYILSCNIYTAGYAVAYIAASKMKAKRLQFSAQIAMLQ